jgi:Tfp pilus assembly protein PilN
LETRKLIYENLPSEKRLFLHMFYALSTSLPDGVWLNKIKLSRKSSTFKGFSFKPEYISYFYNNINKHYSKVDFSSIKRKTNKVNEYYTFSFSLSDFKLEKKGE